MHYRNVMEILSQSGLGAAVISGDGIILEVSPAGDRLLHGKGSLEGLEIEHIAAALLEEGERPAYANIAFGEYLARCPAPAADGLPAGAYLLVFRDATRDAGYDMLRGVVSRMNEAMILFDDEGRVWMINDAAVKLDSIAIQDVQGKTVEDVYFMLDGSEMAIPRVLRNRQPLLNLRQYYGTCYGKHIDIVSNTYPILENGQLLGAFNLMNDLSGLKDLHKKIIDLQDELLMRKGDQAAPQRPKSALAAQYQFSDIICRSAVMRSVVSKCRQVAKNDSSVMIYGETGTGKELFAQGIHNASRRAAAPFLAINCAAIPENLLESLLFGTEKGAYTGAERRPGLFEQADGGTLLLDEINSMNINLQSKLLRVLQDGVIRRVGGMTEIRVNVRVLSNINMLPQRAIAENRLRRDLFYRLGVVTVTVPPLRERKEDIAVLSKHFIMKCNQKMSRGVSDIDKDTLERFYEYNWPGNVRELQHAIEHAINILPYSESVITPAYLPEHIGAAAPSLPEPAAAEPAPDSLHHSVKGFERQTVCRVLLEHGGNISESARVLQMSRQSLQYRIRRYQINVKALLEGQEV